MILRTLRRSVLILGLCAAGGLGALAPAALAAAPAPAASPTAVGANIVELAAREMREVAGRACRALDEHTRAAIARLVHLKREGASNDEIRAAARAALEQQKSVGEAARERIRAIRERAANALTAAGAGERMFRLLNEATERNLRAVNDCLKVNARQIARAVSRLTGDGGGDDGGTAG